MQTTTTSAASPRVVRFLGERAHDVIAKIEPVDLRDQMLEAIETCAYVLEQHDAIDLGQYELAELGTPDLSIWNDLAPAMRNLLLELHQAAESLLELFPCTTDMDREALIASADDIFALVDNNFDAPTSMIDAVVARTDKQEELGQAIATLVNMLKKTFLDFGAQLRRPDVVADRWNLLGTVHEFRAQCESCLEAIIATILNTFANDKLEEVLPRYQNVTKRAVSIRQAIADLSFDISDFNAAIQCAPLEDAKVLQMALRTRLEEFARNPVYRQVTPQEKRVIIMLRIFLNSWERDGAKLYDLRRKVDDTAKCLELVRSANCERLLNHDRHYLKAAEAVMKYGTDQAAVYLRMVYGRSEKLDLKIRALESGPKPLTEDVLHTLREVQAELDRTV